MLFNKILRILPITIGRTNVQNPLDFVTALLDERHKRGRLRHRGVLNHKIEVSKLIHKELILFLLSPIVILFLDYIMSSNNLLILDDIIKGQFKLTSIIDPNDSLYKVKIALMYTLSIMAIILVYYLLIWLITFPIFIFIFLIFKSIIQLSKMIDKLFPKKPLVGIAVILFVLSSLYLYYS